MARSGTRSPCRGTGRRRGVPPHRVIVGKDVADPDQTHPQAVSKLGHQAPLPIIGLIDLRADLTFVEQVRSSLADEGLEFPGTSVHDGLLHGV
jgi:hypothetical protein